MAGLNELGESNWTKTEIIRCSQDEKIICHDIKFWSSTVLVDIDEEVMIENRYHLHKPRSSDRPVVPSSDLLVVFTSRSELPAHSMTAASGAATPSIILVKIRTLSAFDSIHVDCSNSTNNCVRARLASASKSISIGCNTFIEIFTSNAFIRTSASSFTSLFTVGASRGACYYWLH